MVSGVWLVLSYNFQTPDEWPRWRRCFEQFRIASGLSTESEECQVSTLLYYLGSESEDILASTSVIEEVRKSYPSVLKHFDDFFKVWHNVIFERACFNQRNQKEGESCEQYIAMVYSLAEHCEFVALKEEIIRDRLW